MASSLILSAKDLKCVKAFVTRECLWRIVSRDPRYREYIALCPESPNFCPDSPGNEKRHICCQLILLRRHDAHVVCLAVNGRYLGSFRCGFAKRTLHALPGMGEYYTFAFNSFFMPVSLGFDPVFTPPVSNAGDSGLTAAALYEYCSLVSEDEARAVVPDPEADVRVVKLGGVCSWAVCRGGRMNLYAFALAFDLFATCCDRSGFPSMAHLLSRTVACNAPHCLFCKDLGKHVDSTCRFVGCVPDAGLCFCYVPCRAPACKVGCEDYLPFFTDAPGAASLTLRSASADGSVVISADPSRYLRVLDGDGKDLGVKTNAWVLLRWDDFITRMVVLSCPVLKRLVLSALDDSASSSDAGHGAHRRPR